MPVVIERAESAHPIGGLLCPCAIMDGRNGDQRRQDGDQRRSGTWT